MDVATLGLTIDNGQAVQAAQKTGEVLDEMGTKGEAAAAKVTGAGGRIEDALTRGAGAARRAAADHEKLAGSTSGTTREMGAMAAMQAELTGRMGEHSLAIGRVERSMESLVARMTGANDTLALTATALAKFGLGEIESLGILAGLLALVALYDKLTESSRKAGEAADAALKKIHEAMASQADGGDAAGLVATRERIDRGAAIVLDPKDGKVLEVHQESRYAPGNYEGGLADMRAHSAALQAQQNSSSPLDLRGIGERKREIDALAEKIKPLAETEAQLDRLLANGVEVHDRKVRPIRITAEGPERTAATAARDQAAAVALAAENVRLHATTGIASALELEGKLANQTGGTVEVLAARARAIHDLQSAIAEATGKLNVEVPITRDSKSISDALWKQFDLKRPDGESVRAGALSELRNTPDRFEDLINQAHILQTIADTTNAQRVAQHKAPLGPGQELTDVKKQALEMGQAMERAVLASNLPLRDQVALLDQIQKRLKEIGDTAGSAKPSSAWANAAGYARSAADAANLFGGSRGAEWGNILNTAANATTNVEAAVAKGGTDPIADVQAALSIASLGKQIFSLGRQSHETRDRINEANLALKDTMSIESDILNHNPLQAMLDQVKQAYDQQYASINATLPGLKNQTQRNIDLAAATDMYNQKLALTQQQFALQQSDFNLSMQARKDAAMGLTFDAAKLNLQIQQQNEMANVVNTYGKDSIEAQTLATVQNSEMLRLVNESLTQLTNSPTGFFAETYASDFATRQAWPTSSGSTTGSGGSTVTGNTINITVPDAGSPADTARAVVAAIRQIGQSTVGLNGSVAQAMEYM